MRRQKLKRKDFQKILEESPYYQDGQTWGLQLKSRRRTLSTLVCIWCTFSCLSGREGCLAEVLFLSREDLHSCKATLDKHKIIHITRDELVSEVEFNRIRQQLEI